MQISKNKRLLTNKAVFSYSKRKKNNLNLAWTDFKKSHLWNYVSLFKVYPGYIQIGFSPFAVADNCLNQKLIFCSLRSASTMFLFIRQKVLLVQMVLEFFSNDPSCEFSNKIQTYYWPIVLHNLASSRTFIDKNCSICYSSFCNICCLETTVQTISNKQQQI